MCENNRDVAEWKKQEALREQKREFRHPPFLHCWDFLKDTRSSTQQGSKRVFSEVEILFGKKCIEYWQESGFKDVVVIPSLSLNTKELQKVEGVQHYEERALFNLMLLRHPSRRIIFVSSVPLDVSIIEYYWKLLPTKVPFHEIRHRLVLLSTYDSSCLPLSAKVIDRPRLIHRIQKAIRDPASACLIVFNSTKYETRLSKLLGIPLLAADESLDWWGTKAGSREIFGECGICCSPGTGDCRSDVELAARIVDLCEAHREAKYVVVKLNEGFGGEGNALLDIRPVMELMNTQCTREDVECTVLQQFNHMSFQGAGEKWETYKKQIPTLGCIAELYLENATYSPSVQGCIDTNGDVILLSTHEQMLGGKNHQVYKGCSFPANEAYRELLHECGLKVGQALAKRGAIDNFSVDFVAVPTAVGEFEIYALEINLRKGGTTHPMMTLKFLVDGYYDQKDGLYKSSNMHQKYYVSTDNLQDETYKGLLPHDIMEIFQDHELHFKPERERGVVFHLLGALSQHGKIGVTCIENSEREALDLFSRTTLLMNAIAEDAQRLRNLYWNMNHNELDHFLLNPVYQEEVPIHLPT